MTLLVKMTFFLNPVLKEDVCNLSDSFFLDFKNKYLTIKNVQFYQHWKVLLIIEIELRRVDKEKYICTKFRNKSVSSAYLRFLYIPIHCKKNHPIKEHSLGALWPRNALGKSHVQFHFKIKSCKIRILARYIFCKT